MGKCCSNTHTSAHMRTLILFIFCCCYVAWWLRKLAQDVIERPTALGLLFYYKIFFKPNTIHTSTYVWTWSAWPTAVKVLCSMHTNKYKYVTLWILVNIQWCLFYEQEKKLVNLLYGFCVQNVSSVTMEVS